MPLLFVFDMDDVLYDYDYRERMAALHEITGHDLQELRRRWWHHEGEWRAEAGGFADGAAYLDAVAAALDFPLDRDDWLRIRGEAMTPRLDALAAVARAAELGRVSLLTNNGPLIGENLPTLVPDLVPLFGAEHLRSSSYYGARKPDPEVFLALLAEYDEPADHVFFADDLPENVEGARSVGITAHLYTDAPALHRAIEDFAAGR